MNLSKRKKRWLYYNLERWVKDDAYLKHLNPDVCLSKFKKKLKENFYLKKFIKALEEEEFNQKFKFFRKENNFFHYHSLKDNAISMLECWEEILTLFDDTEILTLSLDERKVFGNLPNTSSHHSLKVKDSYKKHILACQKSIKKSFLGEYDNFKQHCLNLIDSFHKKKEENSKIIFLQTDLKSFYHSLDIMQDIACHIDKDKFCSSYKWLEYTSQEFVEKGLPVGWSLSGLFAALGLIKVASEINSHKEDMISQLPGIIDFDFCFYVDDVILISEIEADSWNESIYDNRELIEKILDEIQKNIDRVFRSEKIQVYRSGDKKTRFYEITGNMLKIMHSNFFDFNIDGYGKDTLSSSKWTALDDFLLPCDNDLVLNERIQFYQNLKNLRKKIEVNEIAQYADFEDYLKKIIYKLQLESKYLNCISDIILRAAVNFNQVERRYLLDEFFEYVLALNINMGDLLQTFKQFYRLAESNDSFLRIFRDIVGQKFSQIMGKQRCQYDLLLLYSWLRTISFGKNPIDEIYDGIENRSKEIFFFKQSYVFSNLGRFFREKNGFVFIVNEEIDEFLLSAAVKIINREYFYGITTYRALELIMKFFGNAQIVVEAVKEMAYFLFPTLEQSELYFIHKKLIEISPDDAMVKELGHQILNYDTHFEYFNGKNVSNLERIRLLKEFVLAFGSSRTGYRYKNPKCFNALVLTTNKKTYLFYREVLVLLFFSCMTITDFLKIIFFQYNSLESIVFLSWESMSRAFSPLGIYAFECLKGVLNFRTNTMLKGMERDIQGSVPVASVVDGLNYLLEKSVDGVFLFDLDYFKTRYADTIPGFKKEQAHAELKMCISNISFDFKTSTEPMNSFRLNKLSKTQIDEKVMSAIRFAGNQHCDVICFPELTLPSDQKSMDKYFMEAARNKLILIGGVEYIEISTNKVINATVISFPVNRYENPIGKGYLPFIQFKNYPSIREYEILGGNTKSDNERLTVVHGQEIIVFRSSYSSDFAVLTCSDFLSLKLKSLLQGMVQTIFVPAMNYDNTTYYHVAQSAIRELYCYCVVVNNSHYGSSLIAAPFSKNYDRTVFSVEGEVYPDSHVVKINPSLILQLQQRGYNKTLSFKQCEDEVSRGRKVNDFKQPPPDWFELEKKSGK